MIHSRCCCFSGRFATISVDMSVETISLETAVNAVKVLTAPSKKKNFQEVFGTAGCLLNCEKDREKKDSKKSATRIERFTVSQITASSKSCRCCRLIEFILRATFSRSKHDISLTDEYTVTREFELKRYRTGVTDPEVVQLFQPRGMSFCFNERKKCLQNLTTQRIRHLVSQT